MRYYVLFAKSFTDSFPNSKCSNKLFILLIMLWKELKWAFWNSIRIWTVEARWFTVFLLCLLIFFLWPLNEIILPLITLFVVSVQADIPSILQISRKDDHSWIEFTASEQRARRHHFGGGHVFNKIWLWLLCSMYVIIYTIISNVIH